MKDLKLIDFEKEPYLGSGRLYQTSEVYKFLKQQAELTRKETVEECKARMEELHAIAERLDMGADYLMAYGQASLNLDLLLNSQTL